MQWYRLFIMVPFAKKVLYFKGVTVSKTSLIKEFFTDPSKSNEEVVRFISCQGKFKIGIVKLVVTISSIACLKGS